MFLKFPKDTDSFSFHTQFCPRKNIPGTDILELEFLDGKFGIYMLSLYSLKPF